MCEYIKDDGEQCGMDNHDGAFCHMHEDTEQAERYHSDEPLNEAVSEAVSGAESDASGIVMDGTCEDCKAPLRRTERLTEHPNMGGRLLFEAVVECDCGEHVLGAQSVRTSELPEGWV